jgi:hypothetical protein
VSAPTDAGPTFSIAIRGFRPHLLRETLASVMAQTFRDFEVLVYDDAGGLDEVIAEFDDERIRHVRTEPGQDPGTKIRTALNLCRGAFVGVLDDDDLYDPAFLERVLAEFERDPRVGVVFTNHHWLADGKRFPRRKDLAGGTHERFLSTLVATWPVALSAAMLRREAWVQGERDKPIPPGVWGDRFTWMRTAEAGWAFHYIDELLATYRVHPAQMSKSGGSMRHTGARTLEAFEFSDPEAERLRRGVLAHVLIAKAAWDLSEGHGSSARADLARARALAPGVERGRRIAFRVLATAPAIAPAVARAWRKRPQRSPVAGDLAAARRAGEIVLV